MAKPGQQVKAAMAGARDLAQTKARLSMSDEEAIAAAEMIEVTNGMRCGGCGKRIGRGFHFTSVSVREEQPIMRMCACARDDCGFASACRVGATYVEQVEYVWLDEQGMNAPPAGVVVEKNRRLEEHQREREAEHNGSAG